jgi:predicted metalloprotease
MEKDMLLMETGMNALRGVIANEDACDKAITKELTKGPKRVRIASREELKMDVNKYKNITLRLMDEMKKKNIKIPSYAGKANLTDKENGLRPDESAEHSGALAHLEVTSAASIMDFGDGSALNDSGIATEQ